MERMSSPDEEMQKMDTYTRKHLYIYTNDGVHWITSVSTLILLDSKSFQVTFTKECRLGSEKAHVCLVKVTVDLASHLK